MPVKEVVPGFYQVSLGFVNAFLIDEGGVLTLVDTGIAGSAPKILSAVGELGKTPADIRQILITQAHGDHTGSLAELVRQTGAAVYMHPADAALIRRGISSRPSVPAPGLLNRLALKMMGARGPMQVEPAETDHALVDGQELAFAGGLCAIAAPGHCAGQMCFLWPHHGGVLIAGDAARHMFGRLSYPFIFEDLAQGRRDLARLAGLEFEVAVFGHGAPITSGAAQKFRAKWGNRQFVAG